MPGTDTADMRPIRVSAPFSQRWRDCVAILLACCVLCLLPACQRQTAPGDENAPGRTPPAPAIHPADAVYVLRDRLLARDGAGFARVAVPPSLQPALQQAWRSGHSRWPVDELPLDARLPAMLAALQAPHAEQTLMATFHQQFAHADADIDQAIRTLTVFASEYIARDPDYSPEQRQHLDQVILALGRWALAAPLADPQRAQRFFSILTAAAARTGIDARAGWPALAALGMTQSLNRLSAFFATLLAQLHQQYGLDLDGALHSLHVTLLEQTGDRARLRLQYVLAGTPIDAIVPAVRIDGHWYLADIVADAQRALAGPHQTPPPETGGKSLSATGRYPSTGEPQRSPPTHRNPQQIDRGKA